MSVRADVPLAADNNAVAGDIPAPAAIDPATEKPGAPGVGAAEVAALASEVK